MKLRVIQNFIDKRHTRYSVGEEITAEKKAGQDLLKAGVVEEILTEEEIQERAEAEKAKLEADKAKSEAEAKKLADAKAEAEKPKKEKAK